MPDDEKRRSATDDLASGLGLLFSAAKKVIGKIDRDTIERGLEKVEGVVDSLGERAAGAASRIDRDKVRDMGRKAVKNVDPRKVEEFAEEAGREFVNVVGKVASRVEGALRDLKRAPADEEKAEVSPKASRQPDGRVGDEEPVKDSFTGSESADGAKAPSGSDTADDKR